MEAVVYLHNRKNHNMKKLLTIAGAFFSFSSFGQGFPSTPINWSTPVGGYYISGTGYGYNSTFRSTNQTVYANNQNWSTMDMNGDGKADLVVCAQANVDGETPKIFNPSSPYWKVYLGNGTAFASSPINWPTPVGGMYISGVNYGYNTTSYSTNQTVYANNQNWSTMDVNGDKKPDLVVCAQANADGETAKIFNPSSPYWKVYLNTGSGFSSSVTNWSTPVGGMYINAVNYGYNAASYSTNQTVYANNQNWSTMDMNGDNKPDLVVCAQANADGETAKIFSPSSPYWKVYLSTGSGFSSSVTNWSTPVGGIYINAVNYGYNQTSYSTNQTVYANNQNWSAMDMNGDNKPDLVVCAQANVDGEMAKIFSPSSPYWKVYINSGSGFSSSVTNWSTPVGGIYISGVNYGLNSTAYIANFTVSANSQNWSTLDMNGDNKPDLVVCAQANVDGEMAKIFSPSSPYWKVYINSGSGFSSSVTNWSTPVGGKYISGVNYGLSSTDYTASFTVSANSQNWSTMDMNGDNKPDLVICAQAIADGQVPSIFSPSSNPYWKVYLNNGLIGVNDLNEEAIAIYPNPFNDRITLDYNKGTATLYNILGEVNGTWQLTEGKNELNVADIAAGIYILQLINEQGKVATKKLLKELR